MKQACSGLAMRLIKYLKSRMRHGYTEEEVRSALDLGRI
jgi:hypothetical protein